ncbi:hypothetical protein E2R56_28985 [Rhodococcus qingshengii]|nr:hypothetical protein E2R56_28985 [Rhodococcus qingshengii]
MNDYGTSPNETAAIFKIADPSTIRKWSRQFEEHGIDGTPIRLAYPNEKLDIVIKKHNLHRITIHGLRHTHASLLFEAGASIKEVQERLGHSDFKMTMNIYTHVTITLKEQTAAKFQRYIEL